MPHQNRLRAIKIRPTRGKARTLPRIRRNSTARALIWTAARIDADEAYRIGLVNRIVAPDALIPAATEMLKQILANGPLAVAACIEAVTLGLDMSLEGGLALEANHFALLAATSDMREGTKAFLEKRPAEFTGK